jgi:hypothetical protein
MSVLSAFKFKTTCSLDSELPDIYPIDIDFDFFVSNDLISIFSKILTDCAERTQGLTEKHLPMLWDNCLASEAAKGLISLLSESMAGKKDLFIVYNKSVDVIRMATQSEIAQIKADYNAKGYSDIGVYISFKNFNKTDMIKIYSSMEYSVLNSLNKTMNLAQAIQFKMSKMRESVGAIDSAAIISQARSIANSLKNGHSVLLDGEDQIITSKPDMESTKQAIEFLDAKRAFYLDMPLSYITGEQTGGIGSTGENDSRAVERGLKHYYVSILKPVIEALFGITTTFKSHDFRQITSALEAVKTFELIGNDMLSQDSKRLIIEKLFDIEGDNNVNKVSAK